VAAFFYSCGNSLLDFMGNNTPEGAGNLPIPETTAENVPKGVTPIYIDTQEEFNKFCFIGMWGVDYPLDGYYILRGNGVSDRTFHASSRINPSGNPPFTGTLTGWYMDEAQKTKIKIPMLPGFFAQPMVAEEVSWLKFETEGAAIVPDADIIGIVAREAESTRFDNVTVAGTINIMSSSDDLYVGGIVGKAGASTEFVECTMEATINVTLSTSDKSSYVGGIAGEMQGTVTKNKVSVTTFLNNTSNTTPVNISSQIQSGTGEVYVGGVAGKLTGTIQQTVVIANVTAIGKAGNAYGGGFAGLVDGGAIKKNTSTGPLTVSAESGGDLYSYSCAGGLAGESRNALSDNHLSGTVSVTSRYYSGSSYSGGLVGKLAVSTTAKIENSSINGFATILSASQASPATPPGTAYAGGLAGYSEGPITKSSFTSFANVSAGFVLGYTSTPPYSQTTNAVATNAYAGGIAGFASGAISDTYASVTSYESDTSTAALAGIDARISESNGIAAAGGIAGKNAGGISQSYAAVTVKARAMDATDPGAGASVGGISGISTTLITNSFALAKVDARPKDSTSTAGKAQAGGIVGYLGGSNGAMVTNSYAAGWVMAFGGSSVVQSGGIAGYVDSTATTSISSSVALQQYVAGNGTNRHRVVGTHSGGSYLDKVYAYTSMKSEISGQPYTVTPGANTVEGGDINASDAQNISYYAGLGWSSAWIQATPYPALVGLPPPSVLDWATLLP
jgi:hypothetical protein